MVPYLVLQPRSTKKYSKVKKYVAAQFPNELPESFLLGDGRIYGRYYNRPLESGTKYTVALEIVTDENVSTAVNPKMSVHSFHLRIFATFCSSDT